jgi:predicted DNA-binding transcriptional regulator AlpA
VAVPRLRRDGRDDRESPRGRMHTSGETSSTATRPNASVGRRSRDGQPSVAVSGGPGEEPFGAKLEILADSLEWAAGLIRAQLLETQPLGMPEVGELLDVARDTVAQWRQRGIFPAPELRIGGSPAWRRSTVIAWAESTGRWHNGQPTRRRT